jgi:hypothetical protein
MKPDIAIFCSFFPLSTRFILTITEKMSFHFSSMMASSSKNHGIPLPVLLEWYKIRDMTFEENFVSRDISQAIQLASSCAHPYARWFAGCCGHCLTLNDMRSALLQYRSQSQHKSKKLDEEQQRADSARAMCFAALLSEPVDVESLRQAAEKNDEYAQALLAASLSGEESFAFAQKSAAQGLKEERERECVFFFFSHR